jgi:hypothetical protein
MGISLTSLELGNEESFASDPIWLFQLASSLLPKGKSLFPELRSLVMGPHWTMAPVCPPLMTYVLTPSTTYLALKFSHNLPSTYLLRIIEVIPVRAPKLKELSLLHLDQSREERHTGIPTQIFDAVIGSSLERMISLESITLEPSWVNARVLDALGNLQNLKILELIQNKLPTEVTHPPAAMQRRVGEFTSLENLEICTNLVDLGGKIRCRRY